MTRVAKFFLVLIAIAFMLEGNASAAIKPQRATLDASVVTIDLAERSTHQLTAGVLPEGASKSVVWKSGNTKVATVSKTGLVTGVAIGRTSIGVRPASLSKWTTATVRVTDSLAPNTISVSPSRLNLYIGGSALLTATLGPDTAITTVRWDSSKTSVAIVTKDGEVLARKAGTTYVRAISTRNPALYATVRVTVKNLPPPSRIDITPATAKIERGEKLQLTASVSPLVANTALRWYTNNAAVATVDKNGLISAKKVGKFKVKAASKIRPKVYRIGSYEVVDTKTVTGVVIDSDESVLLEGGTLQLKASVLPSTASQEVSWSSSNPAVARISDTGLVTAVSVGSTTITVTAGRKYATQRVVVMDASPVTDMPDQVTSVDGISQNLAKIDAIQRYATQQVDALRASGAISKSEADARKKIIVRAFSMARFPWMSDREVRYWSGNSLYQKNVVYYGIPYTQKNRVYNTSNIVKSKAFKLIGENDYYTAYMPDRSYPGNDCSSFVSMNYWGLGSKYSYLRSRNMFDASVYKTVAKRSKPTSYLNLRPGDFFVRNGHVAMFLYYTNSLRNQVMIIQQGGRNTLNTVGLFLKPLSYYSMDSRYIARRKRTFA